MIFVVDKVINTYLDSYAALLRNREVYSFEASDDPNYFKGWVLFEEDENIHSGFCEGFTIIELDDEGYLL